MFYISEGGTNMKKNHKVSFRWKQMVLILIAGLFLTGAQPAEAKTKNVSPFKTFKLGALNVKKRVNESLWMCDNAFEASDGVPEAFFSYAEMARVKKGSRVRFKLKKGYKITKMVMYYTKNGKRKAQKLKNKTKLKAGGRNIQHIAMYLRKGKWRIYAIIVPTEDDDDSDDDDY